MHCVYWAHLSEHTKARTEGYIGVTSNLSKRKCHHITKQDCLHLGRAINKYAEGVLWNVYFHGTEEECYALEKELRPSANIGWNIIPGGKSGSGMLGKKHTEETKRKMSKAKKGKKNSPAHIENMRKARIGYTPSVQARENMRKARIGKKHSPATIAKLMGHKVSNSTKEKIRIAQQKPVSQLSFSTLEVLQEFTSARQAAELIGGSKTAIINACNGNSKSSKGYKWKYKET